MLSRWIIYSPRNISIAINFCSHHVGSIRLSTIVLPLLPPTLTMQVAQGGCKALYCPEKKKQSCAHHTLQCELPTEVFLEGLGRSLEWAGQTVMNKLPSRHCGLRNSPSLLASASAVQFLAP